MRGRLLPSLALLLALLPSAAAGAGLPELIFEAPPELDATVRWLQEAPARSYDGILLRTGLEDPGPPIRVILAKDGSPLAQRVPDWVAGYAYSEVGVVVLLVDRSPSYPNDSLDQVLRHEIAHVLIHRAAGGQWVPRWFHEGVATRAAGEWGFGDRSQLALALVRVKGLSMPTLDRHFSGDGDTAASAYALATAFQRHLEKEHGGAMARRVLRRMAEGSPFEEAFAAVTGSPLAVVQGEFWDQEGWWVPWLPWVGSSTLLWFVITLLALVAFYRRRRRDAELRRRWEEEELAWEVSALSALGLPEASPEKEEKEWIH